MQIVLVPGFTQTASSWDGVRAALGPGARWCRAVDVPIGGSFARTARELARTAGPGVYCGYSMGGRLALRLAIDRPDLVRALVLVSSTAGIADPGERAERVERDHELARSIERDGVDAFLHRWLAQPLFARVPPDAPGLADRHSFTGAQLAWALRDLGTGTMEPMWERLGELHMPVVVVTGRHDPKYELIGMQLTAAIGGARQVHVDAGHAIPLEAPRELAAVLHEVHSAIANTDESTS